LILFALSFDCLARAAVPQMKEYEQEGERDKEKRRRKEQEQ
jgi:hypothetical protein